MKNQFRSRWQLLPVVTLSLFITAFVNCGSTEPLLPRSFKAETLEVMDPLRVRLLATGLGKEFAWAVRDAQKAAIFRVSQDLVQSSEEKQAWELNKENFYRNVTKYAERWVLKQRLKTSGDDIQVQGEVVINRKQLEDDLIELGVIKAQKDLLKELSYPSIAVLAEDSVKKMPYANFALNQAASFLTQRKYEVIDLDQMRSIETMARDLRGIDGIPTDPKAMIALQAGSDIYVVFNVNIDEQAVGRDGTIKASASIKAFETTTARQIGAATGFSQNYAKTAGATDKAVAEALADATGRVLTNIMDYWKDDLEQGNQFLVTIQGDFKTNRDARRIVYQVLKTTAKEFKENLATDQTLNYRVWYKGSNTDLLFTLQDEIERKLPGYRLNETTTNRKLLVLDLKR